MLISKNVWIVFLVFIIVLLLLFFYLFDEKNIQVQPHLRGLFQRIQKQKEKFPRMFRQPRSVQRDDELFVVEDFIDPTYFAFLQQQFQDKSFASKNMLFRKGGGMNFFKLHTTDEYEGLLELYYSQEMLGALSEIVGKPIQRSPLNDENACSLLLYSQEGDFIDWHKDYSSFYGDRYVCLLTLVNTNAQGNGLSQNEFIYKVNGQEKRIQMKPNTLVIFKGSEIWHKSTSIGDNEKRILLSMVFCDICQEKKNIVHYLYEKVKNFTVYG